MFRYSANAATLVPSPVGAGHRQVTLQIVTETFGIVRAESLRTAITRRVCCASVCAAGKLAVAMLTRKRPVGAWASCVEPPPQAPSARAAARAATTSELLPATVLISNPPVPLLSRERG